MAQPQHVRYQVRYLCRLYVPTIMNLFVNLVVNCPLSYITYDLIILLKIFIIYRWNVSIVSLFLF